MGAYNVRAEGGSPLPGSHERAQRRYTVKLKQNPGNLHGADLNSGRDRVLDHQLVLWDAQRVSRRVNVR